MILLFIVKVFTKLHQTNFFKFNNKPKRVRFMLIPQRCATILKLWRSFRQNVLTVNPPRIAQYHLWWLWKLLPKVKYPVAINKTKFYHNLKLFHKNSFRRDMNFNIY